MYSQTELIQFTIVLDNKQKNLLRIRILRTNDEKILSFAIIFTHAAETGTKVIFKADSSQNERVHVHYSFANPIRKEYHNRVVTVETIEHYVAHIKENWQWYLTQYEENYI